MASVALSIAAVKTHEADAAVLENAQQVINVCRYRYDTVVKRLLRREDPTPLYYEGKEITLLREARSIRKIGYALAKVPSRTIENSEDFKNTKEWLGEIKNRVQEVLLQTAAASALRSIESAGREGAEEQHLDELKEILYEKTRPTGPKTWGFGSEPDYSYDRACIRIVGPILAGISAAKRQADLELRQAEEWLRSRSGAGLIEVAREMICLLEPAPQIAAAASVVAAAQPLNAFPSTLTSVQVVKFRERVHPAAETADAKRILEQRGANSENKQWILRWSQRKNNWYKCSLDPAEAGGVLQLLIDNRFIHLLENDWTKGILFGEVVLAAREEKKQ